MDMMKKRLIIDNLQLTAKILKKKVQWIFPPNRQLSMINYQLLLSFFVLILFLQGCGRKGPPVAPPEEALYGKTIIQVLNRHEK